jgi:hypothetical protein
MLTYINLEFVLVDDYTKSYWFTFLLMCVCVCVCVFKLTILLPQPSSVGITGVYHYAQLAVEIISDFLLS